MISWTQLILLVIETVLGGLTLFLLAGGEKYEALLAPLDDREYPLKDTYVIGMNWCEKSGYTFRTEEDKKLRKELELLCEEKYVEYYLRMFHARRFSITLLCLFGFTAVSCLAGGSDALLVFLVGVMLSGTAWYYYTTCNAEKIKERTQKYMSDFPDVLSKLALLVNAGMVMREAWEMTASSADRPLYQEMRKVGEDIRNGVSEAQAYYLFGIRTVVPEIRKFTSSVIQGLEKGNKELAYLLADMSSEMWETRKQDVVRQGELASGKLMIPMLIMFAGILVMVLVPVFSNLGL